ncbi:hypothetical protein PVAP13_3KG449200 [Panicum virgatum]|uniref:Uncharacterized protein n=1 Tax=Panicum virgatum TaxID=38727 RepID=A0A8T0V8S0_PANVG|nr:hypothetical protein PVAP13_3KG449200 [Panicum virgatum]
MGGAHFPGDNDAAEVDAACDGEVDRRDVGKMEHGCEHYRRRCKIVAPCCKQVFPCRHCHNEATASGDRHAICRQDIEKVVCLLCDTEQPVSQVCVSCGVNMGEYFCDICKFYDDDTEKLVYHCKDCGICRVGGKENFFHCVKCGSCYSVALRDNHQCVENSMRQNCPICYEYLFDSLQGTRVLNCGHTMHMECFSDMVEHNKYTCPICSKTALDMTRHWEMLDQEIEATIMPPVYRYKIFQGIFGCTITRVERLAGLQPLQWWVRRWQAGPGVPLTAVNARTDSGKRAAVRQCALPQALPRLLPPPPPPSSPPASGRRHRALETALPRHGQSWSRSTAQDVQLMGSANYFSRQFLSLHNDKASYTDQDS